MTLVGQTRILVADGHQSVSLPAEFAYADAERELTITRHGDVITLQPKRMSLREAVERLRAMPTPPNVQLLERTEARDIVSD